MAPELILLSRTACRGRDVTAPRLRDLLALLAGDLRTGSGTARLVAGLWPEERPENPAKALQVLVSRARAQLGADLIAATPTGYRLALPPEAVDASAVLLHADASARLSRAGDHAAALAEAERGLALWDGPPPDEADGGGPLSVLRAERAPVHRALVRARALSLARLGRRAEAVEPLAELCAASPRDEEQLLELLRCEAATAGPAAALARYETYRRTLRDGLGAEPGPALRAAHRALLQAERPVVRHGVAHEPNPLLGRDTDVAAVSALIRASRVTSITGPGGLGKTRLAHTVGRSAEQPVVHFVSLVGVRGDEGVAREVASFVALEESRSASSGRALLAGNELGMILGAIGTGPALLVLDNCEHVVRGAADLVGALVSMTSELRVLTTSRAPLGLSSESVYPLPELALPVSVALFEQRARAARPGVALPRETVEELCRHLDGLPLAVELAAARVRIMSVPDIAARLGDRFALLRGGIRDAPERHRTLHAVVEWSWNLLGGDGRAALRALSVFPGGFTAAAAERVLGGDAYGVLEHLADQSLLKVEDTPAGTRFRMLETVREFSARLRDEAGETPRATGAFLAWAREFGLAHAEEVFGPAPRAAADLVRAEQDNLVLALRLGTEAGDGATIAATGAVLGALWTIESNYARMIALAEQTARPLSHYRPPPEYVEAVRAVSGLSTITVFSVQGPRATRALATLRRLPATGSDTLVGAAATVLAHLPEALAPGHAALLEMCASEEPYLAGLANGLASYVWQYQDRPEDAIAAAERMLAPFEDGSSVWITVMAHSRITELCLQECDGARALVHLRAAMGLIDRLGPSADGIGVRGGMVLANTQVGEFDEAERWIELAADHPGENPTGTMFHAVRAEIAIARGDTETGLDLWRRAANAEPDGMDPLFRTDPPGLEPWTLEAESVAVIVHACRGRLAEVADILARLERKVVLMLGRDRFPLPAYQVERAILGVALLALAVIELERGERAGDAAALRRGARLTALAERFRYLRQYGRSIRVEWARATAGKADGSAYDEAVSSYADLDPAALRAEAAALLAGRVSPCGG